MKRLSAALAAAAALAGCAEAPVVMVSGGYAGNRPARVALLGIRDYPGVPGSGDVAAGIFEKYLLLPGYRLVERRQVTDVLREQALAATGAVKEAALRRIGELLGADALVFGDLTAWAEPADRTILADVPQEHSRPVYGKVVTERKDGDVKVTTEQPVVTGYESRQTWRTVAQTETTPARGGLAVRLVDVRSGEVLWSAADERDGPAVSAALEDASARLMRAVARRLAAR